MNRADFLAALGAATIAPSPGAAITADISLKRDADDLLTPFSVSIAVHNPTPHIVGLDFPTADIYRIDVLHDEQAVWSTATGHKPLLIARRIDVAPGLTRLASQIVDGTTDDRRAYAPGRYIVHVAMLGKTLTTTTDQTIAFNAPRSIADARRMAGGSVVTIAGVQQNEAGSFELLDATGGIRISRPLGLHPSGTYIVRGFLDAVGDDVEFAVGRFAPAFDNFSETRTKPTT